MGPLHPPHPHPSLCALQSPTARLLAQGLLSPWPTHVHTCTHCVPSPPQASTQIPWCSICHKLALMEAGEWLPDAAQAGGPGPRGRPGPTLPPTLLRNGQDCPTGPMEGSQGERRVFPALLSASPPSSLSSQGSPARGPQCDPRAPGPSHLAGWQCGDMEAQGRLPGRRGHC